MALSSKTISRLILTWVIVCSAAAAVRAQTPAELRARYGDPQESEVKNDRPVLERYLVRPKILLTIRYTKDGLPSDANLAPVSGSTPKESGEHDPGTDYMSTDEVLAVINELVPVEKRGNKVSEFMVNGGDRKMKLHHPGCSGFYVAEFKNVSFSCSTWCWGGTFSVTIRWGKPFPGYKSGD